MSDETKQAIELLKDLVKESHIKGQKHIDFSLANSNELESYKQAMAKVIESVRNEELTDQELKESLGLI